MTNEKQTRTLTLSLREYGCLMQNLESLKQTINYKNKQIEQF